MGNEHDGQKGEKMADENKTVVEPEEAGATQPTTLDEVLKDKALQSEFDSNFYFKSKVERGIRR